MAGTPANSGERVIGQKGQGQLWLGSANDVKFEIENVSKKLREVRTRHKSFRNHDSLDEACKLLSDWNEDLLSFCKANRKKYMIDDKTLRMDKKLLEYETMIKQYQDRERKLQKDLTDAIRAKDTALNRLSEIQSRLLKMNNPEITDLSDENRPTVLGERLKRVYEDEWTDAFEFLTEKREEKLTEEQTIDILFSLLKKCHELSAEALQGQHVKLAQVVYDPTYLQVEECLNEPKSKPQKPVTKDRKKLDVTPQPMRQMNNNSKQPLFSQSVPPSGSRGKDQKAGQEEEPQAIKGLAKTVINKNQQPWAKENLKTHAALTGSNAQETQKLPASQMSSEAFNKTRAPDDQTATTDSHVVQTVKQFSGPQSVNQSAKTPGATQSHGAHMSNKTAKTPTATTTTPAQKLGVSDKCEQLPDFYDARETADTTKPTTMVQKANGKFEMPIREFSKIVAGEVLANFKICDILPAMKKTGEFPDDIFRNQFVVKYIEECFHLCWLMQVQCPPMLMDLDTKPGSAFDANLFDIYSNRGPKIAMVVWPPIHLHKGGPLVSKGYAEGAK